MEITKEKYLKLLDITILLLEERIQKKETVEQLLKEAKFEKQLIDSEIYSIQNILNNVE